MLESENQTTSSSDPEPVDIIDDSTRLAEGLVVKNKIKRLLVKMNSGEMSALDWRLVYGVLERNFRKHDHKANLSSELAHTMNAMIVHRLRRLKNSLDESRYSLAAQ